MPTGGISGGPFWKKPSKPMPSPQQAYPASITQAGTDYDRLMGLYNKQYNAPSYAGPGSNIWTQYMDLLNPSGGGYQPITPERMTYEQTPDVMAAMSGLKELSQTGGLSGKEQADLRARGVSPIRAAFASAMRGVERQKSLQGGYSPGYNAAMSRMAREQSESAAGAATNVNAAIAEMVQRGRLSAAPQYAQFAGQEAGAQRGVQAGNIQNALEAARLNMAGRQSDVSNRLAALSGMTGIAGDEQRNRLGALQGMLSLYGTTPALAQLFGNQVLQQGQLQQQGGLGLIQALLSGLRGRNA